jgi:hypothetical protein
MQNEPYHRLGKAAVIMYLTLVMVTLTMVTVPYVFDTPEDTYWSDNSKG